MKGESGVIWSVVLVLVWSLGLSSAFGSMTFVASYNTTMDADYAAGSASHTTVGNKQYLSADGEGKFSSSSPNKALVNTTDSRYSDQNYTYYQRAGNLDPNHGSVILWATRIGATVNSSGANTFFSASNSHIESHCPHLDIYATGQYTKYQTGDRMTNMWLVIEDGSGHRGAIHTPNYYIQMPFNEWTFFGATWDYDSSTGKLNITFYVRDRWTKQYLTGSIDNWDPTTAGSDKIFVGTGAYGSYSGPNKVDQVVIYNEILTESDFDALYASNQEIVPEPATVSLVVTALFCGIFCRKQK